MNFMKAGLSTNHLRHVFYWIAPMTHQEQKNRESQSDIKLPKDVHKAEAQIAAGAGVSHDEARRRVLEGLVQK